MSGVVDRSGCARWCGTWWGNLPLGRPRYWTNEEKSLSQRSLWCSPRCRDLALPPIDSSLPGDASVDARPSATASDGHARGYSAPAGGEKPALSSPVAGTASSANVPLGPGPGQRWELPCGCAVDFGSEPRGPREFAISPEVTCRKMAARRHVGWVPHFPWMKASRYIGPTPTDPPATNPPPPAASLPTLPSRQLVGAGAREGEKVLNHIYDLAFGTKRSAAIPSRETRVAGITCPRCLITSAGGDQHLADCPRGDFDPVDGCLSSEAWSVLIRTKLEIRAERRAYLARPFVPSVTDEDLFGKAVR